MRCCTRRCYAQGTATRWAAQPDQGRIRASSTPLAALDGDAPLLFTGEMIYPWMLASDPVLAPLADAAELLAQRDSLAGPV